MKARFLVPARAEFNAAINYDELHAARLGADFLVEVEHCVSHLLEASDIGAPRIIGGSRTTGRTAFDCTSR